MNKSQLIAIIADRARISKADAGRALDALTEAVTESLKNNEAVTLIGFGTFEVKVRAARTGHNPNTGEPITLKASSLPSFKPSKLLKNVVNVGSGDVGDG